MKKKKSKKFQTNSNSIDQKLGELKNPFRYKNIIIPIIGPIPYIKSTNFAEFLF